MSLATRIYSDIDLNFEAHPITKDITKLTGTAAIIGSLKNLFSTSFFERLFQPYIGCNLKQILFEPIDAGTTTRIRTEIELTIKNFEPRVELTNLNITPNYDDHRYDITMTFYIVNNPNPITINFFLERVR